MYSIKNDLLKDFSNVLMKLITGEMKRVEAFLWYENTAQCMKGVFPVTSDERSAHSIFPSMRLINRLVKVNSCYEYFLRKREFTHYLTVINGQEAVWGSAPFNTVVSHKTGIMSDCMPVSFRANQEHLEQKGILFSRLIDEFGTLLEEAIVRHNEFLFVLTRNLYPPYNDYYLEAKSASYNEIETVLDSIGFEHIDLIYVMPQIDKGSYKLLRMDDNGNVFFVASFDSKLKALSLQKKFESSGHKQLYYIVNENDDAQQMPS